MLPPITVTQDGVTFEGIDQKSQRGRHPISVLMDGYVVHDERPQDENREEKRTKNKTKISCLSGKLQRVNAQYFYNFQNIFCFYFGKYNTILSEKLQRVNQNPIHHFHGIRCWVDGLSAEPAVG